MFLVVAILTLAIQADARVDHSPSHKSRGLPLIAGGAVLLVLGSPRFRRRN
jgi:hypothetical protein